MSEASTLTISVPSETKVKLEWLAGHTSRTREAIAGEALSAYVDSELAIIASIERGREEIRSGGGLGTDEVFRDVEAAIAQVEADRAGR